MLLALLALSANSAFAAIPGWDRHKLTDFCNGTCPSTPDSSGLPRYGQSLFPSMTADSEGRLYIISAKFGGAYLDAPKLTCYSPAGEAQWTVTDKLAPGPQSAYWMQFHDDALYVQSSSCCSPQGATKGHIVKVSLNGTALSSLDVVGSPVIVGDLIYTIATPDTGKGSIVSAMSLSGKVLWTYNDGVSRFSYLEIGGAKSQYNLCMPAQAGQQQSVVCLDNKGKLAHSQKVADSPLIHWDLIANGGKYIIRINRDNSYYHKGANELYEVGPNATFGEEKAFKFPDDIDFVGPISRTSGGSLVALSRPDCPGSSGMGCRPDHLIALGQDDNLAKMRWNITLPGAGDLAVNPGYPPQFGPYGSSNGMVFTSTVKKLHGDNKTYDMWYSAIDQAGTLVWKETLSNMQDLTRVTYGANAAGDFHVIFDGVLYKVPARGAAKSVYV